MVNIIAVGLVKNFWEDDRNLFKNQVTLCVRWVDECDAWLGFSSC